MSNVINPESNDFSNILLPYNVLTENFGESLAAEQLMLEHEAYTMGEARFLKTLERQIDRGEICDNAIAKPLIDTLIPALSAHMQVCKDAKPKGKPPVWTKLFKQVDVDSAAVIVIKTILMVLAKEQNADLQRVANNIANNIEDEVEFGRIRDQEAKHFKQRVKPNLDKRNGMVFKKAYMQAVQAGMLDQGQLTDDFKHWDKMDKMNLGIRIIEMVIESTKLITLEREHAGATARELVKLSDDYTDKLTSRAHALAGFSPMHQPMIVPPKKWTSVRGGGYWAKGRRPLSLIRVSSKRALERYRDVEMPEVYKAINLIQETAWKINTDVLAVVNQVVNWDNCPVSEIPSINKAPKPVMPEDYLNEDGTVKDADKVKNWKREAAAIYRKEKARQSKRLSLEFALEQANKFSKYDAIYFPYNLDWRGRVYAIPMFNPQGDDKTKALLTFSKGVKMGEHGEYYLAIQGANVAGVDKVSLADRVQWVYDNETMILACADSPLDNLEWSKMDKPFSFLAFCFEWAKFCASGKSQEFIGHLPVAFDGTCSGLQHFSAMLRDSEGGRAVNLTPADVPQDIYGIVAEKLKLTIAKDLKEGTEDSTELLTDKKTGEVFEKFTIGTARCASVWNTYGVTRKVTKRSVMTLAYGSSEYGFSDQVMEDTIMPAIDSGKGAIFGSIREASQYSRYMAKLIWQAVKVTVIAAVEAMAWLQDAAKLVSSKVIDKKTKEVLKPAMPVTWTTPAGFPVWSEYTKQDQKRIDLIFMGQQRIRVRINSGSKLDSYGVPEIDTAKQASGISPNFIHSQDASHLQLTTNDCGDKGIDSFAMIHDSFGTHAGSAHIMFNSVRHVMVVTYRDNDVIQDFYNEFESQLHESQLDKMPTMPSKGTLNLNGIMESEFTFS